MAALDPQSLGVLLASLLAFPLTLLWIAVHAWGAYKVGRLPQALSPRAKWAWGLSFLGGFTGPCVILASLVAFGLALSERARAARDPEGEASRLAATVAAVASAIILVMALGMAAAVLVGQALA